MSNSIEILPIGKTVFNEDLVKFVDTSYAEYAMYVLYDRALLLVDGLKPVQRRLLYYMWKHKMFPNSKYSKGQMIAGGVSGTLHPHGDAAIAEALAKLGQPHRMRVPLIDCYGNVGEFTGDDPASPRYWEARLSPYAMELLDDLKENGVEFKLTFDGEMEEPIALPVRFPNSVINGTQGIAVGHSAKIPSHNPTEVLRACIALLKDPNLTIKGIMQYIKGPDFITGGTLKPEGIQEYLETGSGSVTMNGRYRIEKLPKGKSQIVFYELPYEVSVDSVITSIKELMKDGKITEISSIDNFSGIEGLNLTITTKSGVNPGNLVQKLQKISKTGLTKKFPINMTVIYNGKPERVGILELLTQFLDLRRSVSQKVLTTKLEKLEIAISKNDGILAILADLDRAIEIIKTANNSKDAEDLLIKEFNITQEQAEYILSLPLRKLTKADREELIASIQAQKNEKDKVAATLENPTLFAEYIENQLLETMKIIGSPRKTAIVKNNAKKEITDKAILDHERRNGGTTLYLTPTGEIFKSYKPTVELDKPILQQIKLKVQDSVMTVTGDGLASPTPLSYLEINDYTSGNLILGNDKKIVGLIPMSETQQITGILLFSSLGGINVVDYSKLDGKPQSLIKLSDGESLINIVPLTEKDSEKSILLLGTDGYSIVFPLEGIRSTAPGAKPIKGINSKNVIFGGLINDPKTKQQLVTLTDKEVKVTYVKEIPTRNRGAKGSLVHKTKSPILQAYMDTEGEILFTNKGADVSLPGATDMGDTGTPIVQSTYSIGKSLKDNL